MFSSFLTSILTFWALARSNGKGTCALAETLLKTPNLIYLLLQRALGYLHISYIHGCFDEDDTKFQDYRFSMRGNFYPGVGIET